MTIRVSRQPREVSKAWLEPNEEMLPLTECLVDTANRVKPYFDSDIAPAIKAGKKVLIAAHGNSLRALVMELEHLTAQQIISVEIPTGSPLVYELDEKTLKVLEQVLPLIPQIRRSSRCDYAYGYRYERRGDGVDVHRDLFAGGRDAVNGQSDLSGQNE
jgi:bisphosphoglycerate-dependent phosphoglycerate mutase family 1